MIKPVSLFLRALAVVAVAVVRIAAAVVEAAAELSGIAAYEVLVPALRGLQRAQDALERDEVCGVGTQPPPASGEAHP